jgi:hypothetical protein
MLSYYLRCHINLGQYFDLVSLGLRVSPDNLLYRRSHPDDDGALTLVFQLHTLQNEGQHPSVLPFGRHGLCRFDRHFDHRVCRHPDVDL